MCGHAPDRWLRPYTKAHLYFGSTTFSWRHAIALVRTAVKGSLNETLAYSPCHWRTTWWCTLAYAIGRLSGRSLSPPGHFFDEARLARDDTIKDFEDISGCDRKGQHFGIIARDYRLDSNSQFYCLEGQTASYRGKFVSATNFFLSETCFENSFYRGDKGRAAGQKDNIDVFGLNAGRREERIDAPFDLRKFLGYPLLKRCPLYCRCQIHKTIRKLECRLRIIRQVAFDFLHGAMKMKSEVFVDEVNEGFDLFRLKRLRLHSLQHLQNVSGF